RLRGGVAHLLRGDAVPPRHRSSRAHPMSEIEEALRVLGEGGVVACPTETLVGLLADATRGDAVEAVLRAKGRSPGHTVALLVPSFEAAASLAELSPAAEALARAHWPGPLTLVARA